MVDTEIQYVKGRQEPLKQQLSEQYSNDALHKLNIELTYNYDFKEFEKNNCVLIRHGLSEFNYQWDIIKHDHGRESLDGEQGKIIRFDPKYFDSPLHEIGIQQSQNQQEIINQIDFQVVFVSPLTRALQTTENLFMTHPNRQNIKFIILPHISESAGMASSIQVNTLTDIKDLYSQSHNLISFDFSEFDNFKQKKLWMFEQFGDEQKRNKLLEEFDHLEPGTKEFEQEILKLYITTFPNTFENKRDLKLRSNLAKEKIKHYFSNIQLQQNKKIGIISHAVLLMSIVAKGVDEQNNKFIETQNFSNCNLTPYEFLF